MDQMKTLYNKYYIIINFAHKHTLPSVSVDEYFSFDEYSVDEYFWLSDVATVESVINVCEVTPTMAELVRDTIEDCRVILVVIVNPSEDITTNVYMNIVKLQLCMYIHMYVYMINMYIYMCICICTYMCVSNIYVHMYVCMNAVCTYDHMYICIIICIIGSVKVYACM